MMMIPFQVGADEYSVFVILEAENVRRMAENDPAQINVWKMPDEFTRLKLRDVIISTPSPEDIAEAVLLIRSGKSQQALEFLSRGFKFKPKEGDNDLPYQRSTTQ